MVCNDLVMPVLLRLRGLRLDKRADAGRSVIASPYIYSLSLAVYATAWTFYGSVGRAAANGVGFLPIYIGPTLAIILSAARTSPS